MDDGSLFDAWANGDPDAGDTLVAAHYGAFYAFFDLRVPRFAADLVQETFLACLAAHGDWQRRSTFRAFLFGIARHQLLRHLREKQREGHRFDFAEREGTSTPNASASRIVAQREEQQLLLRALEMLPLEVQLTLHLFYWQDLSTHEIGDALGIPKSTVTTRLDRARRSLRDAVARMRAPERHRKALLDDLEGWTRSMKPV